MYHGAQWVCRNLIRRGIFPAASAQLLVRCEWRLARAGQSEPELLLVPQLADSGRLALDIGANWGPYSATMRRYSAGVIAFEPQPQMVEELRRHWPWLRVEPVALGDRTTMVDFSVPLAPGAAPMTGYGRVGLPMLENVDFARFEVPMVPLDSFDLPPVGLMKIDVEGGELAVVRGATDLLRRDRPNLIIESEDHMAPGCPAALVDHLAALGYAAWFIHAGEIHAFDEWHPQLTGYHGGPVNNFVFTASRARPV